MKKLSLLLILLSSVTSLYADLKPIYLRFSISTDKESYYEGEKINIFIKIKNIDKENSRPVLLPHTQNTGQKLFTLNVFDKAKNYTVLRYSEDKMLNMWVHDTGTVQIRYLKPEEEIVIPIYLNDFDNYYAYYTQNASHHSFGTPLFAGIYQINLQYNPKGIPLGDSIYNYFSDFDSPESISDKMYMHEEGALSPLINLKIKRSSDTLVSIERKLYYIKTDGDRYFYFNKYSDKIITDTSCQHITNIPPDSCTTKNEYFYSYYYDLFAEYINRFEDGDIREYRKFRDWCPSYLFTLKYDENKKLILYQSQLYDKRFYSVSYLQPSGKIKEESYCSENGTHCLLTQYIYNKKGELIKTKTSESAQCVEIEINGKKRGFHPVDNLEDEK